MINKLKPFDLDSALRGEPVMLRDGSKAFVRHHETELPTEENMRLVGFTADGIRLGWCANGSYYATRSTAGDDIDIIGMWPKTRIINGFEVPAPDTETPALGSKYFIASNIHKNFFNENTWYDYEFDKICLERGLVFLNKEDAIANAKAMLGF